MAGVNKVILVGHLGKDPETRAMPSGDSIANITIATSESWKDKTTGEKKEVTEWHRIVFFNKLAEIAGQYLKKGSQVYVEGSLRTRKWQDKDGQDRYTTEIRADKMVMLGKREAMGSPSEDDSSSYGSSYSSANKPSASRSAPTGAAAVDDLDDDIPF